MDQSYKSLCVKAADIILDLLSIDHTNHIVRYDGKPLVLKCYIIPGSRGWQFEGLKENFVKAHLKKLLPQTLFNTIACDATHVFDKYGIANPLPKLSIRTVSNFLATINTYSYVTVAPCSKGIWKWTTLSLHSDQLLSPMGKMFEMMTYINQAMDAPGMPGCTQIFRHSHETPNQ